MTTRADRLRATLTEHFAPTTLVVQDDSARHAGHKGAAPGGETHFNIEIVSEYFTGLSRVARSRAVYQAIAGELAQGLHAVSLALRTQDESFS